MSNIESLVSAHLKARRNALNLNVSENRLSDTVLAVLSTDLQQRYHAGFYAGTDPAQELIAAVTSLAKDRFKARFASVAPLSGNMCVLATVYALTHPLDEVARLPLIPGGGYPFNYKGVHRYPLDLPFDTHQWQVDVDKTLELLAKHQPPLVMLGASMITYPVPVTEVAEEVHDYGGLVAYDGSHVFGLIAGGEFQDPLREGADVLFGSTHKSFPGPQGGLVLTNNEELDKRLEKVIGLDPLEGIVLVDNPHLHRIASLGLALEETPWERYARQVVLNSQAIAKALTQEEVPLRGQTNASFPHCTYTHQVLPEVTLEEGTSHRDYLAQHQILTDGFARVGTSEVTRLGFTTEEASELGSVLAALLKREENKLPEIREKVEGWVATKTKVVL